MWVQVQLLESLEQLQVLKSLELLLEDLRKDMQRSPGCR